MCPTIWTIDNPYIDSYSDIKNSNWNIAQIDNYGFGSRIWDTDDFPPFVYPIPERNNEQYSYDEENGVLTIKTENEIREVRVITNGVEKQYKLVPVEKPKVKSDPVKSNEPCKIKKRNKRRTPSKQEKTYYAKFGKRFTNGNTSCRNDILNEILEYQKSHPTMDWRLNDRLGIYNFLFNNYSRPKSKKY